MTGVGITGARRGLALRVPLALAAAHACVLACGGGAMPAVADDAGTSQDGAPSDHGDAGGGTAVPFAVRLAEPAGGTGTPAGRLARLVGRVEGDDGNAVLEVTVNGTAAAVTNAAAAPAFDFRVPVRAGTSLVVVQATARDGRTSEARATFEAGRRVAAGLQHGAARDAATGALVSWGASDRGALGRPGDEAPAALALDAPVVALAASTASGGSVAVDGAGHVLAWGDGQATPRSVGVVARAMHAAAGGLARFVLDDAGALFAFGAGERGQLGLGEGGPDTAENPTPVPGLANVTTVCAGSTHAVALVDGVPWAFGGNDVGQLGRGSVDGDAHRTPAPVELLTDVVDLACGRDHTIAVRGDGSVWAWGNGASGQLGHGESGNLGNRPQPTRVSGTLEARRVFAGANVSWAADARGRLFGWGQGSFGQLGVGSTGEKRVPTPVAALEGVVDVAAGGTHAVFATTAGVFAAGSNTSGQLGREGGAALTPVPVELP